MRYARDVLVVGCGVGCIIAQIILQYQGAQISEVAIITGVTLLTAEPFIKLGDRRVDADSPKGRHEANSVS